MRNAQQRGGPEIEFHGDVHFHRLAPSLETTIFRIVQEALTNACRHSQSQRVRVELTEQAGLVHIEIEDWGVGFVPEQIKAERFGLRGIRDRARLFGGSFNFGSKPGDGTRIVVELPIGPGDTAVRG